jgi:thiol-disulfide isomerase/thioredoxin
VLFLLAVEREIVPFSWLPWALVVALTVALVATIDRGRQVRGELVDQGIKSRFLQQGAFVPAFVASTTSGLAVRVGSVAPDSLQLIVLVTSGCPFCQASEPAWHALSSALAEAELPVRMLAVTTDTGHIAISYAHESRFRFDVVPIAERRLVSLLRASTVPQMLLVNADGRVLYSRLGTLPLGPATDSTLAAIRERLAVAGVQ